MVEMKWNPKKITRKLKKITTDLLDHQLSKQLNSGTAVTSVLTVDCVESPHNSKQIHMYTHQTRIQDFGLGAQNGFLLKLPKNVGAKRGPWPPDPACIRYRSCRVLKDAGSQSVVSVCQHTLRGLVAARFFIGWQWSSEKLLSCVCLSWVHSTLALVYLGVFGVAVCGKRTRHSFCLQKAKKHINPIKRNPQGQLVSNSEKKLAVFSRNLQGKTCSN